jgi:hypothetical protein
MEIYVVSISLYLLLILLDSKKAHKSNITIRFIYSLPFTIFGNHSTYSTFFKKDVRLLEAYKYGALFATGKKCTTAI